ncbi:unnamed protein product [Urochloa decumbens]|uniref:NAC domain-containing protein n=1 Tax=Urochloa decumbens TaxID=240449 RepID=A0ABC9G5K7_9POAL
MGGGDGRRSLLPPGFRFRPTDEELLTHYLAPKAADAGFAAPAAIREVDLYGAEPWDLLPAARAASAGGYFFCRRSVKYPSGLRTNRATRAGYWKSTGKDKLVLSQRHGSGDPIGLKKTLVFYRGRAPAGRKTDWVMHEYRLAQDHGQTVLATGTQSEWVICRVFTRKPPGETILPLEQKETVLQPPHPLNDHLNPPIIDGCNNGGEGTPAAAVAAATDPTERTNCCSSDALAIALPADRLETAGQVALNLYYEELAALDYASAATPAPSELLQHATLLGDELSSEDSFDLLSQLLDYEGFPFLHDF